MIDNANAGTSPPLTLLTSQDLYLFNEGRHYRSYNKLGAHLMKVGDESGTCFSLWAPNAKEVSVIGGSISGTRAHIAGATAPMRVISLLT